MSTFESIEFRIMKQSGLFPLTLPYQSWLCLRNVSKGSAVLSNIDIVDRLQYNRLEIPNS
jgi:hypothetical protein